MRVFIDTGAFVALRNRNEEEHESAREMRQSLADQRATLFTSNFVFAETYSVLLTRIGRGEAIRWGSEFRGSRAVELIRIDEELEEQAWTILETHTDKAWSYVDATSFALMAREGTRDAFAFDHHFQQRGLSVLPAD